MVRGGDTPKPALAQIAPGVIAASHQELGKYWLSCDGEPELLFTENESSAARLWSKPNPSPFVKDAFHAFVTSGQNDAVNPLRPAPRPRPITGSTLSTLAPQDLSLVLGGLSVVAAVPSFW